ncbi:unnamed protein product [Orchesella dallaii]|uniref:Uncharacterized protein n=1 Tax=Orchesella dallaii TaxID=48710 RepID=A0ABP1S7X6_9HEXA
MVSCSECRRQPIANAIIVVSVVLILILFVIFIDIITVNHGFCVNKYRRYSFRQCNLHSNQQSPFSGWTLVIIILIWFAIFMLIFIIYYAVRRIRKSIEDQTRHEWELERPVVAISSHNIRALNPSASPHDTSAYPTTQGTVSASERDDVCTTRSPV